MTTTTRGYILLETVVSGAIIATAVLSLITQLSGARVAGITAAREQTAARLVAAELEMARARQSVEGITSGVLRDERVAVGAGGYGVRTVASPMTTDPLPRPGPGNAVVRPRFIAVTSTASFDVDGRTRTVAATTRLYR